MKHLEDSFQKACADFLFKLEGATKNFIFHHSPNGGKRNIREAARFKSHGTRAGYPDFVIHKLGGKTFFIELKVKGNTLSVNQETIRDGLEGFGYSYHIIKAETVQDALYQLKKIILEEGI